MLVVPQELARGLRARLDLGRGIETGTYRGRGARLLAEVFPQVITIEVVPELARAAARALSTLSNVEVRVGSSRDLLPELVDPAVPAFYWLDGHWSGGATGGAEDQCPVLGELAAIAAGHPDDCILIDDARLFLAPPPPPHQPEQWPTYVELENVIRAQRPGHRTIVAHDVIVSVPERAFDLAAAFAAGGPPGGISTLRRALDRVLVR